LFEFVSVAAYTASVAAAVEFAPVRRASVPAAFGVVKWVVSVAVVKALVRYIYIYYIYIYIHIYIHTHTHTHTHTHIVVEVPVAWTA
jgi:hypothetical protein